MKSDQRGIGIARAERREMLDAGAERGIGGADVVVGSGGGGDGGDGDGGDSGRSSTGKAREREAKDV